jgi:excisionase family DNA binding protein
MMICVIGKRWSTRMTALLERDDTVVPSEEDSKRAAEASRSLASKATAESELKISVGDGPAIALPRGLNRLLSDLLAEMAHGNAVTIIPFHAELTTQEAADYLNVSRPHLIDLLEKAKIKFRKVGTHRRIKFEDLRKFKASSDAESEAAMEELAAQAQKFGMGY